MADLVTLAEVRAVLEYRTDYTERDSLISTLISRASQAIENETEREFTATSSASRRFRVDPRRRNADGAVLLDLAPYDLRSVTTLTQNPENTDEDSVLTANTDYVLSPVEGAPAGSGVYTKVVLSNKLTWTSTLQRNFGYSYVDVAGAWGFSTTPTIVKQACIETVKAWLEGLPPLTAFDVDEARTIQPELLRTFSIPRRARYMLGPYYRSGGVF